MKTIRLWCFSPEGQRYRVFVQERQATKKIAETRTETSFPLTLKGWNDANAFVLRRNIEDNPR